MYGDGGLPATVAPPWGHKLMMPGPVARARGARRIASRAIPDRKKCVPPPASQARFHRERLSDGPEARGTMIAKSRPLFAFAAGRPPHAPGWAHESRQSALRTRRPRRRAVRLRLRNV